MLRTMHVYSGTVTATGTDLIPAIDFSHGDQIHLSAVLTGNAGADANDKMDVYLQSRGANGQWDDRAHLAQFTGAMLSGEGREAVLSKFVTLADAEEASEPSGSTGAARLAAGAVKNGAFPGPYLQAGSPKAESWRLSIEVTTVTSPSFPVKITVGLDTPE